MTVLLKSDLHFEENRTSFETIAAEPIGNAATSTRAARVGEAAAATGAAKPTVNVTAAAAPEEAGAKPKKGVKFSAEPEEKVHKAFQGMNKHDRLLLEEFFTKGNTSSVEEREKAAKDTGLTVEEVMRRFDEYEDDDDTDSNFGEDEEGDEGEEEVQAKKATLGVQGQETGEQEIPLDSPDHPSRFNVEYLDNQYKMHKELGRGAFGVVSLGVSTERSKLGKGVKVAVKKMTNIFGNPSGTKRLIRELRVLRILDKHPSLTRLLDLKIPTPHNLEKFSQILMIFECMDSDVSGHLKNLEITYTETQLKSIVFQIICGLNYMHSANFVHRDLKPQNILMRRSTTTPGGWDCKLCDFGLARCFSKVEKKEGMDIGAEAYFPAHKEDPNKLRSYKFGSKLTRHVVTRYYRAPEISLLIQKRELLPAVDMWSIGCILGELLQMIPGNEQGRKVGRNQRKRDILLKGSADLVLSPRTFKDRPIIRQQQLNIIFKFLGTPSKKYIDSITNAEFRRWINAQEKWKGANWEERFPNASSGCLDLMRKMLSYDATERFTTAQCLQHPWLAGFEDPEDANRTHEACQEPFEDVYLNDHELRLLVVDEILHFNPEWRDHLDWKKQYGHLLNKTQTNLGQ